MNRYRWIDLVGKGCLFIVRSLSWFSVGISSGCSGAADFFLSILFRGCECVKGHVFYYVSVVYF